MYDTRICQTPDESIKDKHHRHCLFNDATNTEAKYISLPKHILAFPSLFYFTFYPLKNIKISYIVNK